MTDEDTKATENTNTTEDGSAVVDPIEQESDSKETKGKEKDDDDDDDDEEEPKGTKESKTTGGRGKPGKRVAADGEDVEVDDKGVVTMPFNAFQRRMKRAVRNTLKEMFGVENMDDIKKIAEGGKAAQEKLEKLKREQMSEVDRIKADNDKLKAEKEALEQQIQEVESERAASRGERIVSRIAAKYIDEAYIDEAVAMYQRKLSKMDEDEIDALEQDDVEEHFKEYAEKKPAMAAKKKEDKGDDDKKPDKSTRKEPITNGANPNRKPEKKSGAQSSKTPRPNQSNTMTKSEWEAYKRENGISY